MNQTNQTSAAPNEMLTRAADTYNAAAELFDATPLGFWDRHSRRAVELAELKPGEQVFDAGCGTGAAALPAAHAVSPDGHVLGVDIAQQMLDLAYGKAQQQQLSNVSFRCADMTSAAQPDAAYDAVISVFALFFVPDMQSQVAELWRMVRPGGRLVITVWGPQAFEPAAAIFSEELQHSRPGPPPARPWERVSDAGALTQLIREAIGVVPQTVAVADRQPLREASDWWTIVLGSGYRGELLTLSKAKQAALQQRVIRRLQQQQVTAVETPALHAVVRRP